MDCPLVVDMTFYEYTPYYGVTYKDHEQNLD